MGPLIYTVTHTTHYEYDIAVSASYGQLHMMPGDVDGQICLERSVTISPEADFFAERVDYFGNSAGVFTIHEPHHALEVRAVSVVDCSQRSDSFPPEADSSWEVHLATARRVGDLVAAEYAIDSPRVERSARLRSYAEPSFGPRASLAEAVSDLSRRIHDDFEFDPDATHTDTAVDEVLDLRRGVCQDFSHLLIGCLRSMGLAAAYVSGYIETDPPPGQPKLVGADRTHAWVGLHLGDDSWIGIDPTNAQLAGARYVTTARGRDYGDVAPLRGVVFTEATRSDLTVTVDVSPHV